MTASRVQELDVMRGFALGGILLANIGYLADPAGMMAGLSSPHAPGDPVAFAVTALVLTKFYVIFSFLFGYSFTLQMRAAERAGASVRARTVRRCLALFAIGLLHGLLLWIGDILTLYAALGMVLLGLRGIRARTAVITGSAIIGVMALLMLALAGLSLLDPAAGAVGTSPPAGANAAGERALALVTGGPLDYLTLQAEIYPGYALGIWLLQGPTALAMFLFGLAAGKSRLLEDPARYDRLLPRVQWIGFGVGLPAAVVFAATYGGSPGAFMAGMALNAVTSVPLAAAYVATLLRVTRRLPAVGRALAPAGRSAASNYLGQSVLMCLVFTGYGLALAGSLPPLAVLGVAAVIYGLLLWLSAVWLRTHRYGPVEYVLRRITNGPPARVPA
jgi:uncharacterized protein